MTPKRLPTPPARRRPRFSAVVACAVLATIATPAAASASDLGVNLGIGGPSLVDLGITVPGLNLPVITVPSVTVPSITLPSVSTPVATTPTITTPSVTTPVISTPEITVPGTTPTVTVPNLAVPELTPGLNVPPITVPGVTVPPITTPVGTTPEITTPEVTTPEVTVPGTTSQTAVPTPAPEASPAPVVPGKPVISVPPILDGVDDTAAEANLGADGNLHLDVKCAEGATCELVDGEIDLGNGQSIKLDPSSALGSGDLGKLVKNLKILGPDYANVAGLLAKGKCVTVKFRVRVKTAAGDEVKTFNAPLCGSKVTFTDMRRPVATAEKATRRIKATVSCSKACAIKPRFLLVKTGNKVLARIDGASRVSEVPGSSTDHSTIWKLSTRQEADIARAVRRGSKNIRYVVSARASSGGIVTTGTASFRVRTK